MRLRRLELFGFKSFADRTVFEFGDNSLTGVVGPNGCGKSNVVDSVRWVLGEQRPTSMRGAEMTDVIFKGSSSRPGLSVAEATLILDNESGHLAGRGPEVSITRRVFKSGEGEYLLDGQKVRLKDIREMLYDTGLGSRGYSVLEQGKIDAVLSANPLERRRIFEEAAGISRYRQRKVETELRLKRVADDMARLDDVIGELATRLRSLKIQAGKAERYAEAKNEWANERTRLSRHRLFVLDRDLAALRAELARLDAHAQELRGEREHAEGDVETRERERSALVAEIERLLSEIGRVSGDGRALDERRAQLSGRIASWQASARDEAQRAEKLAALLAERSAEVEQLATERAELGERSAQAQTTLRERAAALRELDQAYRERRAEVEKQNELVLGVLRERTDAENRTRSLTEARGPAAERGQRALERLTAARQQSGDLRALETQSGERATDTQAQLAAHEELRKDLARRMGDVAAQVTQLEREKNQLELERAKAQSRVEFLLARERDLEELAQGARRLLKGVEANAGPIGADELVGLVADHVRTDTRHARALDAVLSARGGALVVRDAAAAAKVAAWLKSSQAGTLALGFAAGAALAPRADDTAFDAEALALVEGKLRARVETDAACARLADHLLDGVWVARDLAAAFALVERFPHLRFVTRDGEYVDAALLHAGGREVTQGAVGRRSTAAELAGEIEGFSARIADLEARRGELARERIALQKDWERTSQELEQRRRALSEAQTDLATARARLRDLAAAERALELEANAVAAETQRIEAELERETSRLAAARTRFEAENARLSELDAQRVAQEERKEALAREANQSDIAAARARAELDGVARRHADLERALAEARTEHERAVRLAAEQSESAKQGAAEIEELAQKCTELLEVRAELEEKVAVLRVRAEGGRDAIDGSRRRAEHVTRALEETSARLADQRLAEQKLALERADVLVRAQEELALDEIALRDGFEPENELTEGAALAALEEHVRELRARLDKIGPVNLEAVGELQEVATRHDFLHTQRADLETSRAQLDEAVRTIDSESKRLFLDTFETVRGNFQRIFRQLFGGGRADVQLEEGVDVLEAGVEIIARPPGRELLSIGLLSGGQRTLTALALLFAVFEARPSPFCLLDEVDAALDDANVERFLQMLDGYRQTTQFVVVTHNKSTMTACQSLYGVTMETKGVSRQVSVELSDLDRWTHGAPAAPANARAVRAPAVDAESGEPVVEIVPATLERHVPARRAVQRALADGSDAAGARAAEASETVLDPAPGPVPDGAV